MNATEQLAENWLREELGCKSITFRPYRTPDFVTDQGGFEVKKAMKGGKIVFSKNQLNKLKATGAKILIFEQGTTCPKVIESQNLNETTYYELISSHFMQVLDETVHKRLEMLAEKRGVRIQELIRAVIIPEWLQSQGELMKK